MSVASDNVVFNEKKKGDECNLNKRPQAPSVLQESGIEFMCLSLVSGAMTWFLGDSCVQLCI